MPARLMGLATAGLLIAAGLAPASAQSGREGAGTLPSTEPRILPGTGGVNTVPGTVEDTRGPGANNPTANNPGRSQTGTPPGTPPGSTLLNRGNVTTGGSAAGSSGTR